MKNSYIATVFVSAFILLSACQRLPLSVPAEASHPLPADGSHPVAVAAAAVLPQAQPVKLETGSSDDAAPLPEKKKLNRYMAHRGYSSRAPENTLPAFKLAMAKGADGVELDMQMSRDGKVIVIHDVTVDRTSDAKGAVKTKSFNELRAMDAGSWYKGGSFAGTQIPLLSEVYDTVHPRSGQTVYAEIKDYRQSSDVEAMTDVILAGGWEDRTVMTSFHYGDFNHVRKRSKTMRIAYLCDNVNSCKQAIELAKKDKHAMIHASYPVLLDSPEVLNEAGQAGIDVAAWTVDSPDIKRKLTERGVHTFITNEPELLAETDIK